MKARELQVGTRFRWRDGVWEAQDRPDELSHARGLLVVEVLEVSTGRRANLVMRAEKELEAVQVVRRSW